MPIPDADKRIVEIQMQGLAAAGGSSNKNANFVFHFRRTSTTPAFLKSGIDTAFQAAIAVLVTDALNARYVQTFNAIRVLDDAEDAFVQFNHALPGAVAGDAMAMHNQIFVLMRTGLRGRSFKGGKKLFPLSEADTTTPNSDVLNAAAIARFVAAASAILTGFTDAQGNIWVPVIVSRKNSQLAVNPTIVSSADVTQALVNERIGRNKKHEVKSIY